MAKDFLLRLPGPEDASMVIGTTAIHVAMLLAALLATCCCQSQAQNSTSHTPQRRSAGPLLVLLEVVDAAQGTCSRHHASWHDLACLGKAQAHGTWRRQRGSSSSSSTHGKTFACLLCTQICLWLTAHTAYGLRAMPSFDGACQATPSLSGEHAAGVSAPAACLRMKHLCIFVMETLLLLSCLLCGVLPY